MRNNCVRQKTPGTLTARSKTLNFLRNATTNSRSSHVSDRKSAGEDKREEREREKDIIGIAQKTQNTLPRIGNGFVRMVSDVGGV